MASPLNSNPASPPTCYVVAVRTLCEFTARTGDLDMRFSPSPTAREGIAGHQRVAARRPAPYQTEIALQGRYGFLQVRGRADGFDPQARRLEEIKTCRGDPARIPAAQRALHWAQLRVYGWLLCEQSEFTQIDLALVYLDLATDRETCLVEQASAESLRAFFTLQCERFLAWAQLELKHNRARDRALLELGFPHPAFRAGQRQLAEAVYRSATGARCLVAQAPTGIGKTLGALFPMLKAIGSGRLDRVFFLTAKTSGRRLALDAITQCRTTSAAVPLRVLELTAREKVCVHPDKACHGQSCPRARGFHDRLPAARQAALALPEMRRDPLSAIADLHVVCPYYLAQELVRWSDVVVGDFNHYFDATALLHGAALANGWRVGLIVDEAHNLVERGRAMYSAELDPREFAVLRRAAPATVRIALARVNRQWNVLARSLEGDYRADAVIPPRWVDALENAIDAIGDHLAGEQDVRLLDGAAVTPSGASPLLDFYFCALAFCRLATEFGDDSLFELRRTPGALHVVPCIRNVVPARYLAPRFAASQGTVLMSATMRPDVYYADMLGLPKNTVVIDVDTPFDAAQLSVRVAPMLSTRFRDRDRSLAPIARRIAEQFLTRPGNYLAFFSSYVYLDQAARWFSAQYPQIGLRLQRRGMSEAEQAAFVDAFTPSSREIGFAVLGGAFAEGIDLPGERLIGAFIATLGMPQPDPINEAIRQRIDARFGCGYEYTYRVPGLQKVVQAAGRVIRGAQDKGVLHLLDDRYLQPSVRCLLPAWWRIELR